MHTKDAGTVGELAVALQLKRAGYSVFIELGDNSSIDLIVISEDKLLRGQVKSCKLVDGSACLALRKAGPHGYLRKYIDDRNMLDFFALYVHDTEQIAYISAQEAFASCPGSTRLTFRASPARNKQKSGIRHLEDYADFGRILRAVI